MKILHNFTTMMIIGNPGTGKTCWARRSVNELAKAGHTPALLNADMGQSSIGVPTCLALSSKPPWQVPDAMWFIGDTSPVGNLLQSVVGVARLADRARAQGCDRVVIDTSGLVLGWMGRILKYHKALAARVDCVVAFQQGDELEPLLAVLEGPCSTIRRLRPAAEARNRSAEQRARYRQAQFRTYFQSAAPVELSCVRLISRDLGPLSSPQSKATLPATVVGLLAREGFCIQIGLVEEFQADRLTVDTIPPARVDALAFVQAGKLRLDRSKDYMVMS